MVALWSKPPVLVEAAASKPVERVYSTKLAILVLLAAEACEPSVRGIYGALKQAVPKASITWWMQGMEKEGLLRRKAAPGQGKFVKFTLTAKGKRIAEDVAGLP
jgi:hypothetical protein